MIWRSRDEPKAEPDLASRAQAAVRRIGRDAPAASGGLPAVLVRALGFRRRRPEKSEDPSASAADEAGIRALREELARELARVAGRRRSELGPD